MNTQRDVLRILALAAVMPVIPHAALSSEKPGKPNILVIYADDLGETKNVAAAMPEKVAEMKALLEKLITEGRSTPGAVQKNDVEVVRFPSDPSATPKKKEKKK